MREKIKILRCLSHDIFGRLELAPSFFVAFAFCISTGISQPLLAGPDFDHHRNILPGSKAAGLGGAFTAISDDPSGGYYNPAGLVYGKSNEISVSVNSRQESTLEFKDIESLNGQDFVETSTTFFPSFVGSIYKLGIFQVGWSYMTLDAKNIDQSDRFEDLANDNNSLASYNRTHQESNSYFLVGTSLGLRLGKNLSIGGSLFYYRREIIASNHQLVRITNGSFLSTDLKYTTENEGMMPVVGAMLKLKSFSIGVSYRQPISLAENTSLFSDGVIYNSSATDPTPIISSAVGTIESNSEANPATASLGIAWIPNNKFTLSFDILNHEAKIRPNIPGEAHDLQTTQNYSLGTQFGFKNLLFRVGAFTNNSQLKTPTNGLTNQPTQVDYQGRSSSIVLKTKDFEGDLTFIEQFGTGKSQKLSDDLDIQEVKGYIKTLQVGSKYNF